MKQEQLIIPPDNIPRHRFEVITSPRLCPQVTHAEALREPRLHEIKPNYPFHCWTLHQFLDEVIPPEGEIIKQPLIKVIGALAQKAPDDRTPFLQAIGSRGALGVSRNLDYLSIGTALGQLASGDSIPKSGEQNSPYHDQTEKVFAVCQKQMVNFCRAAIHDVDLDFAIPNMQMKEFAAFWKKITGHSKFYGNYSREGLPIGRDWKTFIIEPKPGIKVFIVQIGLFQFYFPDEPSQSADLIDFSLDFYHSPPVYSHWLTREDARGGSMVAAPERLRRNFFKRDGEILIEWDRESLATTDFVIRYGIGLLDFDLPLEALLQPRLAVEKVARLLRLKTLAPQTWDVGKHLAENIDTIFSPQHLFYVAPDVWREEIMPNILSAIHLSPFIAAANLLPDRILDSLSDDIKLKIANHAIDYSLSLGNLWNIFRNITPQQANILLAALPNHNEWNPTKANGIQLFIDALYKTGILQNENSFGNAMLDAMRLFSHPDDENIRLLTLLRNLSYRLQNRNSQSERVNPDDVGGMKLIISKRNPKWINQSFKDLIAGLVK